MDQLTDITALRRTAGQQLRALRTSAGLTRAAVGASLGFGAKRASAYVGAIEAGVRWPDPAQQDVLRVLFGGLPDGWARADALEAGTRAEALRAADQERVLAVALVVELRGRVDEVLADPAACGLLLPRPFGFFHPATLGALLIGLTGPLRLPARDDAWMVGGFGSPFSGRGRVAVLDVSPVSVVSPRGWALSEVQNGPDLHHTMVWKAGATCVAQLPTHPRSRWTMREAAAQLLGVEAVERVLNRSA